MVTLRTAPFDPLVAMLEARGRATELTPDLLSLVAPHWAVAGYDSVKLHAAGPDEFERLSRAFTDAALRKEILDAVARLESI
jgi:hypothetical protein